MVEETLPAEHKYCIKLSCVFGRHELYSNPREPPCPRHNVAHLEQIIVSKMSQCA